MSEIMASEKIAPLEDRGIVRLAGADARQLLQGLITNDMAKLNGPGSAIHAALLSPQGKILFEFFVVETAAGFLLDTQAAKAADLVKRLSLYRLRADATIADATHNYQVFALWGAEWDTPGKRLERPGAIIFADPRHARLGYRAIVEAAEADAFHAESAASAESLAAYGRERIALGIPDSAIDYDLGDTYPHEADFDLHNGVSFTKGCFVGQEVVARMQNKTVVRKRIVQISAAAPLTSGAPITMGTVVIGKVGSVAGVQGLAMLRLDRVAEALDKDLPITAADVAIDVDRAALERYRTAARRAPSSTGPAP